MIQPVSNGWFTIEKLVNIRKYMGNTKHNRRPCCVEVASAAVSLKLPMRQRHRARGPILAIQSLVGTMDYITM